MTGTYPVPGLIGDQVDAFDVPKPGRVCEGNSFCEHGAKDVAPSSIRRWLKGVVGARFLARES